MMDEPQPSTPAAGVSAGAARTSTEAIRGELLNPDWYRAVGLGERSALLATVPNRTASHAVDHDRAARRLRRWREQPPFANDTLFARRLAEDGMDETAFLRLLGEPAEAVRNRFPQPPAWVCEIVEALFSSSLPFSEDTCLSSEHPQDGLLRIAGPLVRRARERLHRGVQALSETELTLPFDLETVEDLLAADLPEQLLRRVTRTLVLELHVARLQGLIEGDLPEERFASFLRYIADPAITVALFQEYPVLARQLTICINHWLAAGLEFLARLCADWEAIRSTFSPQQEPGTLSRLDGGAGDRHRGGRSVLIAEFSSGLKLVYKPRPLSLDVHFQELLRWIDHRGDHPPLRALTILDRGTHGWVEFVTFQPCLSTAELDRFYRRQGCYLALLHALEATDFHYENLVAAGEHPVLVDLEALFHPRDDLLEGGEASRLAAGMMYDSVLRVGLLPQRLWSNAESVGIDMSGLGGTAGQLTPFDVPHWEAVGTDVMHLVRKRAPIPGSHNRPTLGGVEVDPLDYTDALIEGFAGMYRFLKEHRDELLAHDGPLAQFADDEVRVVLRATLTYATLLQESFHPDVLRDALDRARLFDRLWMQVERRPHLARIIPAEVRDLEKGDIPMFTSRPSAREILTSTGGPIADFFAESALDTVRRRLRDLSEDDLERQVWFVRASLSTLASPLDRSRQPLRHPLRPRLPVNGERLLASARAVGDRLEALALRGTDDVSWIGLTLVDDRHWLLSTAGIELYDGLLGVALFLAHLGTITQEDRYTALARSAVQTIRRQLGQDPTLTASIGAFSGWGGVIYTLTHLAALWRDPELVTEADALVERVIPLIDGDDNLDIIGGAAGCILALLALHSQAGSRKALQTAVRCGDHLLARARRMPRGIGWMVRVAADRPLTGFSHGAAGIALALLRLAGVCGEEHFRAAALDAIAYERSVFSPEVGNWPDLRDLGNAGQATGDRAASYRTTWCHGAPGIGLARLTMLPLLDDTTIREEIAVALQTTIREGFGSNHSLCHGDMGNLELLLQAGRILGEPRRRREANRFAASVLDSIERAGRLSGNRLEVESPGLMTGLAGIGYGLLRCADPDRVPSVLTLAPPREAEA